MQHIRTSVVIAELSAPPPQKKSSLLPDLYFTVKNIIFGCCLDLGSTSPFPRFIAVCPLSSLLDYIAVVNLGVYGILYLFNNFDGELILMSER